jgi:DNA-binding transcriptional ArsR family regulator
VKNEKAESCTLRNIKGVSLSKYQKQSEILAALSNATRLAILEIMMEYGEVCTCELESALNIPQSTVTVHIHKLYQNGLLKKREEWKFTYYSIDRTHEDLIRKVLKG